MKTAVEALIEDFGRKLASAIEEAAQARALEVAHRALGIDSKFTRARTGPQRAPQRRNGPIQLCPAPRCRERAAPVYGMLCAKHKGTATAVVQGWREARRARKAA